MTVGVMGLEELRDGTKACGRDELSTLFQLPAKICQTAGMHPSANRRILTQREPV